MKKEIRKPTFRKRWRLSSKNWSYSRWPYSKNPTIRPILKSVRHTNKAWEDRFQGLLCTAQPHLSSSCLPLHCFERWDTVISVFQCDDVWCRLLKAAILEHTDRIAWLVRWSYRCSKCGHLVEGGGVGFFYNSYFSFEEKYMYWGCLPGLKHVSHKAVGHAWKT